MSYLRSIVTGMAGGLIGAIVAISPWHASATTADCSRPPPSLGNFSAAAKPLPAPDQPFTDETGKERSLAAYRGAALVVNFWATWCGPCIKEMPALDALAKKVEKRGIVVLALSSDREGAPVVQQYFDKNGFTGLPVSIDALSKVARTLDIIGLPTTVFFDTQGRQVGRVVGAAEWDAPATIEFLTACLAPAA